MIMPKDDCFKGLSKSELVDCFCEIFYKELDSWFSADIACCDECYDEFVSKWPAVYSRDMNFQENGIDIKCFYNGSRIHDYFKEEEYLQLIKNIRCPNCGCPICHNFWPYSFKFDLPENFEYEMEEIDRLSKKTPFLLLSNSFAKMCLEAIKTLSERTESITVDKEYYRARKLEKDKLYSEMDFKYPPKDKISEGRYNHAGFPVIYLADSPTTCFYELRRPDEGIAIAEINIERAIKILDLIQIEDDCNNILIATAWSSLMSSPMEGDGWYKPQYTFTRFIADCAISAGFDAIKYPSVRLGDKHNIVILDGITGCEYLSITKITKIYPGMKSQLVD
jgi:hypothetical protein